VAGAEATDRGVRTRSAGPRLALARGMHNNQNSFISVDLQTLKTVTGGVRPAPDGGSPGPSKPKQIIAHCATVLACILGPQQPDPVDHEGVPGTGPARPPGISAPKNPGPTPVPNPLVAVG
jgi:hypothetical protein